MRTFEIKLGDWSDKDEVNANNHPHTREQNMAEYLTGSSSDF